MKPRPAGLKPSKPGDDQGWQDPIEDELDEHKPTDDPAFGMWKDREDLADPAESVRTLRKLRFHNF